MYQTAVLMGWQHILDDDQNRYAATDLSQKEVRRNMLVWRVLVC